MFLQLRSLISDAHHVPLWWSHQKFCLLRLPFFGQNDGCCPLDREDPQGYEVFWKSRRCRQAWVSASHSRGCGACVESPQEWYWERASFYWPGTVLLHVWARCDCCQVALQGFRCSSACSHCFVSQPSEQTQRHCFLHRIRCLCIYGCAQPQVLLQLCINSQKFVVQTRNTFVFSFKAFRVVSVYYLPKVLRPSSVFSSIADHLNIWFVQNLSLQFRISIQKWIYWRVCGLQR